MLDCCIIVLIPEFKEELGWLKPKLEKLIHILEWIIIKEFVDKTWFSVERSPHDRGALAKAFWRKGFWVYQRQLAYLNACKWMTWFSKASSSALKAALSTPSKKGSDPFV
jgi:hypothetical protein